MIEDIEYLKDHCETDSATFFVDSRNRDKSIFPTSSQFAVDLQQPFKLVTGFDILDATVPTTMYNLEAAFIRNSFTLVAQNQEQTYDFDSREVFTELQECASFASIYEMLSETFVLVCDDTIYSGYVLDIEYNTLALIDTQYFVAVRKKYTDIEFAYTDKTQITEASFQLGDFYFTPHGYQDVFTSSNYKLKSFQRQEFSDVYIGSAVHYLFYPIPKDIYDRITTKVEYNYIISNYYKDVEEGNYDISTIKAELNSVWNPYGIYCDATAGTDKKQGKLYFYSDNYLVYNARKSTMAGALGFSLTPRTNSKLYEPLKLGTNINVFGSLYDTITRQYYIKPPGLVNMLGERYVILRIPEIEDHLLGSYAYVSYTPGVGMFKLSSFLDVTNLRFDFVSLVRKPFHPIGKLFKLTFRFETSTGGLYDFKGVDVQLLIMVKFLLPSQKFKFQRSILNPNYDPNFMKYMTHAKSIQYKEDSDQEEEFDTRDYYEMYKKELEKYDYSTSEGETDTDDSEEEIYEEKQTV